MILPLEVRPRWRLSCGWYSYVFYHWLTAWPRGHADPSENRVTDINNAVRELRCVRYTPESHLTNIGSHGRLKSNPMTALRVRGRVVRSACLVVSALWPGTLVHFSLSWPTFQHAECFGRLRRRYSIPVPYRSVSLTSCITALVINMYVLRHIMLHWKFRQAGFGGLRFHDPWSPGVRITGHRPYTLSVSHQPKRADCWSPKLASKHDRHEVINSHSVKCQTFKSFPIPAQFFETAVHEMLICILLQFLKLQNAVAIRQGVILINADPSFNRASFEQCFPPTTHQLPLISAWDQETGESSEKKPPHIHTQTVQRERGLLKRHAHLRTLVT